MDKNTRNELVPGFHKLIWWTIHRNRCLLRALRLEDEDTYQDLAVTAIKAIDSYDPERSASLEKHVAQKLQYAILDMKRRQKPHGITRLNGERVTVLSLDTGDNGKIIDFPYYDGVECDEEDAA